MLKDLLAITMVGRVVYPQTSPLQPGVGLAIVTPVAALRARFVPPLALKSNILNAGGILILIGYETI